MHRETITFAIPFYRGKVFLEKAIASVFAQNYDGWSILVCDEGVEEGGIEDVLSRFDSSRIRHVRHAQRLGIVGNWNACLDEVRTEFVTLLHADDLLAPNYGELVRDAFKSFPDAVAAFCAASIIGPDGRNAFSFPDWVKEKIYTPSMPSRIGVVAGESGVAGLLKGCYLFCPTLCFQKSRLGSRRFEPRWSMVQDLEFTTRLLVEGEFFARARDVGYLYRRHEHNATVALTETVRRFEEEVTLYNFLASVTEARGWHLALAQARGKQVIKFNIVFCILKDLASGNFSGAQRKASFLFDLLS